MNTFATRTMKMLWSPQTGSRDLSTAADVQNCESLYVKIRHYINIQTEEIYLLFGNFEIWIINNCQVGYSIWRV
jgi:hypothetical protein